MKKAVLRTSLDMLVISFGGCLFALAVSMLLYPHEIAPGGVTGLSMILCEFFPMLSLGYTIIIINIPIFLLGWKLIGHKFMLYSGIGTVVSSVMIEFFPMFLPPIDIEPLLAGVFGGLIMGVGLGVVFLRGATTGGSDIIARLLRLIFQNTQLGRLILIFDGCIVLTSGVVFGSINNIMYAAISLYISTRAIDGILYGMNVERMALIISEKTQNIVEAIHEQLNRGATLLHGEGSYTGKERKIIMCAVKRQQIAALKRVVKETDPNAFLILTEANEVLGEGFSDYRKSI